MNNNNLFTAVMELDLEPIKAKLMHVESGEGWSLDRANATEKEYRRFLCLMKMYPNEDTAPLVDVDTFWHYHILDTMKYARDCEQAFGYFLHHYPYVGMRGGDDNHFRIESGERMRTLYEATFGDAYPGSRPAAAATAWCAGPGDKQAAASDGATAWCAGPGDKQAAATAWCAGPGDKQAASVGAATAWCAGPGDKQAAASDGVATAWCAGPGDKQAAASDGVATAWCAGPGDKQAAATAWCAGPGGKLAVTMNGAATAWCAGPGDKQAAAKEGLATAWCAGPGAVAAT